MKDENLLERIGKSQYNFENQLAQIRNFRKEYYFFRKAYEDFRKNYDKK